MGERAHEREADRRRDRRDGEAGRGGAAGRRVRHHAPAARSCTARSTASCPGTDAPPDELLALGDAIGRAGHGVFQLVSDHQGGAGDRAWLVDLVERTGATVTYALAQAAVRAGRLARRARPPPSTTAAAGRRIIPQVSCRPTGMLFGLQSSLHPFFTHPTYRGARRPAAGRARRRRLSQPEVRAALLAEEPGTDATRSPSGLMQRWDQIFPLGDPPDYEPPPLGEHRRRRRARGPHAAGGRPRLAARARRQGVPVRAAGQLRRPRPRGAARDDDRPEHGARPLRRRRPLRPHLRREHAHLPAHPLGERPRARARASASSRPSACRRRAPRRPTASPTAA